MILALAERVEHLLVTDLYKQDARWIGTKTDTPKHYLMSQAPFKIDAARFDAQFMDMTNINYDGPPLDFCYSSCALEHIGKERSDFVKHVADVKKILKVDGVYALTTELSYGETMAYPHNFFFSVTDLLSIIADSGMSMEPILDLRLRHASLNGPSFNCADFGAPHARLSQAVVTPVRGGHMFTSVSIVLSNKETQRLASPLGYEDTARLLSEQWANATKVTWRNWQRVDPFAGLQNSPLGHEGMVTSDRHDDPAVHTAWLHFGDAQIEAKVFLPGQDDGLTIRVVEKHTALPASRRIVGALENAKTQATFKFDTNFNKTYAIVARGKVSEPLGISIIARRSA